MKQFELIIMHLLLKYFYSTINSVTDKCKFQYTFCLDKKINLLYRKEITWLTYQ